MQKIHSLILFLCLLLTISCAFGQNQFSNNNNTFNTTHSSHENIPFKQEINNNTLLKPIINVSTTIYVGPNGKKGNNGLSPDKPLNDIGEALKIAPDNSTIILQKGIYTLSIPITNDNNDFKQGKNLIFQGEDPEHTKIIPYTGYPAFTIDNNCEFTLKNLKIENGNTPNNGGAIWNQGSLTLINCRFQNNNAQKGGAIYNNGNIFTTNCYFKNNQATEGGTLYNDRNGIFVATSCHFIKNNAIIGGAIYQQDSKTFEDPLNIHLTEFQKNSAYPGSAVYLENPNQQALLDNNWWGNLNYDTIREMLWGSVNFNPTLKATRKCKIVTPPIIDADEGYTFQIAATLQNTIHERLDVQISNEPLIFYLDGQKLDMNRTNEDGIGSIISKNYINPGIHQIKIVYPGNKLYDPVIVTSTVNVKKSKTHHINQPKNVYNQENQVKNPVAAQEIPPNLLDTYLKELFKYLPWLLTILGILGSIIVGSIIIYIKKKKAHI